MSLLFRLVLTTALTRSSGANHRVCRATQHHEQAMHWSQTLTAGSALRSLAGMLASWPAACARRRPQHHGPA
jgi:hypothetical protein